jgi:hypothetical protein
MWVFCFFLCGFFYCQPCFSEDLLAEQHRRILVEQLIEIVKQLKENPEQLPFVTFPPEECFSPTRDKRERSADSTARVSTIHRP